MAVAVKYHPKGHMGAYLGGSELGSSWQEDSVVTCGFRLKGFPHDHGNQFLILVCIA